jgi:hypothetical protein
LLLGNLDPLGIGVGVEFTADGQAGLGRCVGDEFDLGEAIDIVARTCRLLGFVVLGGLELKRFSADLYRQISEDSALFL